MPYWCELSPGQQGRAANLSRNQHNSEKYQIFNQVCAGNCDHLQLKAQINSLVKVSVTQSCPTLWDPMACSLPGSSIHGILQARILEWVATSFFRGSSWPRIEPGSPASWADSLPSGLPGKPKFPGILWQLVFLHCSTSANAFPLLTNIVVQSSSHVWLFVTPWAAAFQASLSLTISLSLLKFMSTECHPTILSSVTLFSFYLLRN